VVDTVLVWRRLVGAQIRSQLQYRLSFALDAFGSFWISFIDFIVILVIFRNVPRLAEWSVHQVAFLYALSSITFAVTDMLIGQLDQFPQKIRDGTFDIVLVRPRGTLFQVIASDFALRRIARVLQGAIVLVYALSTLSVQWTVLRVVVLLVSLPSAVVIFSSIWVVGACIAFWTTDGGEFTNAFTYGGTSMAQYPFDIYSTWLRRLLGFVIPLAFVCYFPALYVLGKTDPLGLPRFLEFCSPAVAAASAIVAGLVWRLAVRHYRSAGG
jgi:ABC-2 type transport system permease protein